MTRARTGLVHLLQRVAPHGPGAAGSFASTSQDDDGDVIAECTECIFEAVTCVPETEAGAELLRVALSRGTSMAWNRTEALLPQLSDAALLEVVLPMLRTQLLTPQAEPSAADERTHAHSHNTLMHGPADEHVLVSTLREAARLRYQTAANTQQSHARSHAQGQTEAVGHAMFELLAAASLRGSSTLKYAFQYAHIHTLSRAGIHTQAHE